MLAPLSLSPPTSNNKQQPTLTTIIAGERTGFDGAACPHSWIEEQQQRRSGEETVPWWQPAVSRMARRAVELHEPHPQHSNLFDIIAIQTLSFVKPRFKKAKILTKTRAPCAAEYPAETTGILSAQDNNKNGAQLAVPPDVQY